MFTNNSLTKSTHLHHLLQNRHRNHLPTAHNPVMCVTAGNSSSVLSLSCCVSTPPLRCSPHSLTLLQQALHLQRVHSMHSRALHSQLCAGCSKTSSDSTLPTGMITHTQAEHKCRRRNNCRKERANGRHRVGEQRRAHNICLLLLSLQGSSFLCLFLILLLLLLLHVAIILHSHHREKTQSSRATECEVSASRHGAFFHR